MKNRTYKKGSCNCHRETFPELRELNEGLDRIELAVDSCIKNLNNQLIGGYHVKTRKTN